MAPADDSDPDFVQRRVSDIFRDAAARSTGAAQPHFQRLSTAFDAFVEAGNSGSDYAFEMARQELRVARAGLEGYVRGDRSAANLFNQMNQDVLRATQGYDDDAPAADEPALVPATPPSAARQRGGGRFSL